MMNKSGHVFIHQIGTSLGKCRQNVEQAEVSGLLYSRASALRGAGFNQHYYCDSDDCSYRLAYDAVMMLGDSVADVDAIIYANCIPENANCLGSPEEFRRSGDVKYLMGFPVSRVQVDFELNDAIVVGLNQQACTGMLGSLRLARSLLLADRDVSKVLCISADRFPHGARYEQSYNLISDGAAACLLSAEAGAYRIVACHHVTNGAQVLCSDDAVVGSYFSYVIQTIQKTLQKAGMQISDLDWIVSQNTNVHAWHVLANLLEFDFERVCMPSMAEVGHIISADNFFNLQWMEHQSMLKRGDKLLLLMAGYGSNWQCVILERG